MLWKNNMLSKVTVTFYDSVIINGISKYIWKCDPVIHVQRYQKYASSTCHLDIGPGSGYYLSRSNVKNADIVDINTSTLDRTKERVPVGNSFLENVFERPLATKKQYNSIALNRVLHVVPGDVEHKLGNLLDNLQPNMNDDCVLFGSTCAGVVFTERHSMPALAFMTLLSEFRIFHNDADYEENVELTLKKYFKEVDVSSHGSEIAFVANKPL